MTWDILPEAKPLIEDFKKLSVKNKNLKLQKIFLELGDNPLYQKAYTLLQQNRINEKIMIDIYTDIMQTAFKIKAFKWKLREKHQWEQRKKIQNYLKHIEKQEKKEKENDTKDLENLIRTIETT